MLSPDDSGEIARLFHNFYRSLNANLKNDASGRLWSSRHAKRSIIEESIKRLRVDVETFVTLYRTKKIPGDPLATLHLISYYKESRQLDRGIELWTWAVYQDDQYVNLGTYGAAIELLTGYGKSLPDCEETYLHALERFPSDFNEYHLSPSAIVPLRHQPTRLKGTSMLLLQGIMQARLSHGEWRNAYLALDTALRLHPTQMPPRFLHAFEYERPWFEVFNVFCMIGQSGSQNRSAILTKMFGNIATAQKQDQRGPRDFEHLTAMLTALHVTIASNAPLSVTTLDTFLRIVLEVVTSNRIFPSDEQVISELIQPILTMFADLQVEPHFSTFRMFCKVAALSKRPRLMQWAIEEFNALRSLATVDEMQSIFHYVGSTGDPESIILAWELLKQTLLESSTSAAGTIPIKLKVWKMLSKATKRTGNVDFLRDQLKSYSKCTPEFMSYFEKDTGNIAPNQEIESKVNSEERVESSAAKEESVAAETVGVSSDWQRNFSAFLGNVRRYQRIIAFGLHRDLKKHPPVYDSVWTWADGVDEVWQRKLYDQLNQELDPQPSDVPGTEKELGDNERLDSKSHFAKLRKAIDPAPRFVPREEAVLCPTGYTFEELRYRSWKGINKLLMQAEAFETKVEQSVSEAIEQGKHSEMVRSPHQTRGWRYYETTQSHLEMHLQAIQESKTQTMTEKEWRTRILTLRGLASPSAN